MTVTWAWAGAAGASGFRVVAAVGGSSARLAVADNAAMSGPVFFGPTTPGPAGTVSLTATGLAADTPYWWQVEDDGILDTQWTGQAHTHGVVGEPYSFMFAAAGDAGLGATEPTITSAVSNRPIFDTVRAAAPLFFIHLSDLHYRNITSGAVADYRTAYNDVLTFNSTLGADARQGRLYRTVPTVLLWDDHDYSNDNSDGTYTGKAAAAQAYRECVPSYPLADPLSGGVFHAWQVGRVQFVALDARYYRDPDANPDGPSHTLLGSDQMTWLEQVLADSTSELLIVCSPVQWMSEFTDSWGGFANERGQVQQLFGDYGWLDRMCMLQADKHSMGLDTGANNVWGGFPNYLLASLDANPGTNVGPYDLGITGGRDQYGLIEVEDAGHEIAVTTTGYIGVSPWRTHSFSVSATPPPPPEPAPTPVAVAEITSRVTWLGCNLVTGGVVAELPDITGAISRILGAYTSASLTMPIPLGGPASVDMSLWESATQPGQAMIVAVVNEVPTWAGIVLTRMGGTDGTLQLGCVSLEGYLDRRYVLDHTWTNVDEVNVITRGLVGDANTEGIGLLLDAAATGTLRDRTYKSVDDATVYARLRELSGVIEGPEWTIDLDWTDTTHTAIAKIFRARKRIGAAATNPSAVFQITAQSVFASRGASETSYIYSEDYTDGRGANHVIATSSGEGDERPESVPATEVAGGWARYERRITPSTSIKNIATLNSHADAELALRRDGSRTWRIKTRWDAYPRLNVDWALGDDVAWELVGHRHPDGVTGQGRVIGWELDMAAGTVEPILLDPDGEAA